VGDGAPDDRGVNRGQPSSAASREGPDERAPVDAHTPVVSVVIPTRGRPELLNRAVGTALDQTMPDLEVIVVVDGPDESTAAVCRAIDDPRLMWTVNPVPLGGAEARNVGLRRARGAWVAFLDDDDEWMPTKLEEQMEIAGASDARYPIVLSRLIARSPSRDEIWPLRPPEPGEPISEYLFARRGPIAGEGAVQTSVILAPKGLLEIVPFDGRLVRHQDWDWLLRACAVDGARVHMAQRPLTIWNRDTDRPRIADFRRWRYTHDWARSRRHLMTPKAYASFQLIYVADLLPGPWHVEGVARIAFEALRHGRPTGAAVLTLLGKLFIPRRVRARLRMLLR
jgi:glycosyltransferase involved in cell wall biosynthesis